MRTFQNIKVNGQPMQKIANVIGETEKALQLELGESFSDLRKQWVPKSVFNADTFEMAAWFYNKEIARSRSMFR